MSARPRELLERDDESSALERLIARTAAGEGGVAVVEAPAGVGKTELLRTACELGEDAGLTVLRGRGSELDRTFAFGVVRQLLGREVSDDPGLLTGGAELAAPVLVSGGDEEPGDLGSSLEGLQWLVANLAARTPVVIVADDLHWADRPSLRWLVFLAERIEDVPVLLVAATRPTEPGADQDLLDALATAPLNHMLRPAPLSTEATLTVVRRRLPDATESFAAACHRATGGNPFLLSELLGELAADGFGGAPHEAQHVLEFGSERVGRAVRRRLRLLSPEATALARAVAVLGPRAALDEAAALARCARETAAGAADALAGIQVLAADPSLDFVHPVVRGAVYDQIPPLECQALHTAAVELLVSAGAESEQVARHLLRLPPAADATRVALLRSAAREASARGAAEAAILYLQRALEEPPTVEDRGPVLHELGVAEATDRRPVRFEPHLRAALAATAAPRDRAQIALDLGRGMAACGEFAGAFDILAAALRDFGDPESELGFALESEMLAASLVAFERAGRARAHFARRFEQLDRGEPLSPWILACLVFAMAEARPPAQPAIRLAEQVLDASRLDELNGMPGGGLGSGAVYAGAPGLGARFYDESIARAARRGNRLTVTWQTVMRSEASLRMGEIRRAEAEVRGGLERLDEGSGEASLAWGVALLIDALVARGALDEADTLLARDLAGPSSPRTFPRAALLTSRANLHITRGRAHEALQEARAAGDLVAGIVSNPCCSEWRSPAALALAALERDEEARALAEEQLADARRFEIRAAEGSALRTLGLVASGEERLDLLRESVSALDGSDRRLEHARSLLELGACLRRSGERGEARDVLRDALDLSARIGASGLADRAHEDLVAAGAKPRRDRRLLSGPESLTASEDRVAALAAEGLTNREIAQRLFVTVKAVQWHLRNVYRKLEVASREELPEALELGA